MLSLKLIKNKERYGLGYKPTGADKRKIVEERMERSRAKLEGHEPRSEGITLCDIKYSFRSVGRINIDQGLNGYLSWTILT